MPEMTDLTVIFTPAGLSALASVLFADLAMAGDNAIVIGLAAAGLPEAIRRKIIMSGIIAATLLRIFFSLIVVDLLAIIGLTLAGGLLLLWVAWKLYRDLKPQRHTLHQMTKPPPSYWRAVRNIMIADLSMSLDNVLAVAGAAREHVIILILGLLVSIGLTGAASTQLAKVLSRWPWISYLGLAMVAFIACRMIWDGTIEVMHAGR